jgi:hypothetical protein
MNTFENMLAAGLPHTAPPLDSRILPLALLESRIHLCALLHTVVLLHTAALLDSRRLPCALQHTAAHTAHTA